MTIANRIKSELFNAEINYQYALDAFKAEYTHGISFLGETVSTKAATAYMRLQEATATFNALSSLVNAKQERSATEAAAKRIVDAYNNAETGEELDALQSEYFSLYTIRA